MARTASPQRPRVVVRSCAGVARAAGGADGPRMEGLEGRVLMSFYAAESVAGALGLDRPILDFVVPALQLFWNAGDRGLWSIEDLTARVGPPAV